MKIELKYRLTLKDKNGKVIKRTRWIKSKSFVIAFLKHIQSALGEIDVTAVDTGGVSGEISRPATGSYAFMAGTAGAGVDAVGLVVGTGTATPTNTDYALQTKISHGVGAGQLEYGAVSVGSAGVVGANVDLTVSRVFTNSSGATITVNEIGLYVRTRDVAAATYRDYCIIRDVVPAQDVAYLATLTVEYTLRTTV